MKITNIKKRIGVRFTMKAKGMRKEQEFIIYPSHEDRVTIQSESRIGYLHKVTGEVVFTPATRSHPGSPWLSACKQNGALVYDTVENVADLHPYMNNYSGAISLVGGK